MSSVSKWSVLALAVGFSIPVIADEAIEKISVLGSRIPIPTSKVAGSVSVITQDQIEQSGAFSIVDLLRGQNSLAFSQSGGKGAVAELRLRGSETNHVLVLVDGVAINDIGQGELVDFSQLNLSDIEKIEILRGSQSALWGSGAVGGVIAITTQKGSGDTKAKISAMAGNHKSKKVQAKVSGAASDVNYAFSASLFDTNGTNISQQGDEDDGYQSVQLSSSLGWQVAKNQRIDFSIQHQDATTEFDGTDFNTGLPADADNYTDILRQTGQLSWSGDFDQWQYKAGVQFNRNENDTFANQQPNGANHSDKRKFYLQSTLQYAELSHVTVALEQSTENFVQYGAVTDYGDPNRDLSNTVKSLVFNLQHSISKQFSLTASARYDNNDTYDNATSYNAGLVYTPSNDYRLFVNAGKAVKNPSFVERFGYYATSSFPFVGNPDLSPEESVSIEMGGDIYLANNWLWGWSAYSAELEDEINGYYYDAVNFVTTAVNKDGKSKRKGAETSLQGQIGLVNVALNYSYLDADEPDAAGDGYIEELRRPSHTAGLTLSTPFASDAGNLFLHASYQGTRTDVFYPPYPEPQTTVKLSAYTLVNIGAQYKLTPSLQLNARLENLFDHDYQDVYGYAGAGRGVYLGASYSL
ncbi:TonB-dependent receptor plug domain-containing protein [Neptunicella marina]|uniref:TonB-dependent receptor n=1 Tax=Neptunicella marina TaxID=2125989 RepID=A0A8J6IQA5_9ALTE|nr:TonB-dependent receptor [Neptunicella marina]MBC3765745.1 TonB-dependent receptor [Neptunicella marina]